MERPRLVMLGLSLPQTEAVTSRASTRRLTCLAVVARDSGQVTAPLTTPLTTPRIVLMGVAGSGKTTVGRILAARLDAPFVDADDLHSPAAVAAIRAGHPLDDAQRAPWLQRVRDALHHAGD